MEWRKHHHHFDMPNMENAKHYQVQHSIRCKRAETQTSHPKSLVFQSLHPEFTFTSPPFHPHSILISSLFTLISPLFHPYFIGSYILRFMFSNYFLRILKICLPFKPYRIYEFKSEWKSLLAKLEQYIIESVLLFKLSGLVPAIIYCFYCGYKI